VVGKFVSHVTCALVASADATTLVDASASSGTVGAGAGGGSGGGSSPVKLGSVPGTDGSVDGGVVDVGAVDGGSPAGVARVAEEVVAVGAGAAFGIAALADAICCATVGAELGPGAAAAALDGVCDCAGVAGCVAAWASGVSGWSSVSSALALSPL
jgi:hypothetical protein